jgi:hypothetical protein
MQIHGFHHHIAAGMAIHTKVSFTAYLCKCNKHTNIPLYAIKERSQIEGVWEQRVEENILIKKKGNNSMISHLCEEEFHNLYSSPNIIMKEDEIGRTCSTI